MPKQHQCSKLFSSGALALSIAMLTLGQQGYAQCRDHGAEGPIESINLLLPQQHFYADWLYPDTYESCPPEINLSVSPPEGHMVTEEDTTFPSGVLIYGSVGKIEVMDGFTLTETDPAVGLVAPNSIVFHPGVEIFAGSTLETYLERPPENICPLEPESSLTRHVSENPLTLQAEIPTQFQVLSNYPNPFSSFTSITYGLPEASSVRVEVRDLNGRLIKTLVDGYQAEGWHHISWNTSNTTVPLANGLYLLRIVTNNVDQTEKMTLIK